MTIKRRDPLASLAVLGDPVRRALFDFVTAGRDAVSRDEAAQGLGIARSLAAFHLDRLVAAGLLTAEFRRLSGRTGPGAGRPSKLYRRVEHDLEVSLPPRRYRLAAGWLADAFGQELPGDALREVAREHGRQLGREARRAAGEDALRLALLEAGVARLNQEGYAARLEDAEIRLENCPFDDLARSHQELICGEMNRALFEGFAASLGPSLIAALEPRTGACCMVVR